MTGPEKGFLLLRSTLGDPQRKVLTVAQLRKLAQRMQDLPQSKEDRELEVKDLILLGYSAPEAERVLALLSQEDVLCWYLQKAEQVDCLPITRISGAYPQCLRSRLGLDCPGILWAKGDVTLLNTKKISLVGSRELRPENEAFAYEAGKQAALQGYTLVSGNAKGADRTAQDACLEYGGCVISVVADSLQDQPLQERVLYLSEESYDLPFSPQRALSRNRVIHCLSDAVLIAQCTYGKGGTWEGTTQNLKKGWSAVFCFDDGSDSGVELSQRGATLLRAEELTNLESLKPDGNLFDK